MFADGVIDARRAHLISEAVGRLQRPESVLKLTGKGGNTFEHHYHGRFAPEVLKKGLAFFYGVCQAPTCTKPASLCQSDHRIPFPHGPTTGQNLWPLCSRHHQLKSHGVITWTLPSGQRAPAEPVNPAA